jgi:hypothetical protein
MNSRLPFKSVDGGAKVERQLAPRRKRLPLTQIRYICKQKTQLSFKKCSSN